MHEATTTPTTPPQAYGHAYARDHATTEEPTPDVAERCHHAAIADGYNDDEAMEASLAALSAHTNAKWHEFHVLWENVINR